MEHYICVTCGAHYPASDAPPEHCPICEDDRQFVNHDGQQWTTLARMHGTYRNALTELEPGLIAIRTEPRFAIGERALLVRTPSGNLLWDCISYLDDETGAAIERYGGIAAIAISHPHFYTGMAEWSRRFDAPVYLPADDRGWVMRPAEHQRLWDGDRLEPLPGLTVLRCGGHFPGSSVLHWPAGAGGRGVLLSGDTVLVTMNRRIASFMHSYPNQIPLPAAEVARIAATLAPFRFDRLYDGWNRIDVQASEIVGESAARYIGYLGGVTGTGEVSSA